MSEIKDHQQEDSKSQGLPTARRDFLSQGAALLTGTSLAWSGCAPQKGNPSESDIPATLAAGEEDFWRDIKKQFLIGPDAIYLNNASIGVPPQPVLDALAEHYRQISSNPTSAKGVLHQRIQKVVLPDLAGLIGADTDEIAFMSNATEGLDLITKGIPLKPGDEVLTTTHEHPAGIRPWRLRAARKGFTLREIPIPSPLTSKDQAIDPLKQAMNDRTKVLFFCQVTRGGLLYPVKELCGLDRERGIISAVDGAQAVANLRVDLHDLGCDLYANSLHKWVLAPMGTGMLYVRKGFQEKFFPLDREDSPPGAARYQAQGTKSIPIQASIGAAVEFINKIGMARIEERNRMLSDHLKAELVKVPGIRLISSNSPQVSSPGMTMFEVRGQGGLEIRARFEEHQIGVDEHVRDGHDAVRVSTHFYNTIAEIDRTIQVLRELS